MPRKREAYLWANQALASGSDLPTTNVGRKQSPPTLDPLWLAPMQPCGHARIHYQAQHLENRPITSLPTDLVVGNFPFWVHPMCARPSFLRDYEMAALRSTGTAEYRVWARLSSSGLCKRPTRCNCRSVSGDREIKGRRSLRMLNAALRIVSLFEV